MMSLLFVFLFFVTFTKNVHAQDYTRQWQIQSIDTMKFSRDLAREKATDTSFPQVIENQIRLIADSGATHVAVGTPYDEEFIPFLKRWVNSARKHRLKVWFRGNASGWEGWFEYPKISRTEHTRAIEEFILENEDLFEDGDIFTSCPECENGGPGDPRKTREIASYRRFLISENTTVKDAFEQIDKKVASNYYSMNGDVARLIMDKNTTKALGGIVVIDHYVKTPEQLEKDIDHIASVSGGKIILGEFGAPIPDIHGRMTAQHQAAWLQDALQRLSWNKNVIGLNYWAFNGSSSGLWNAYGMPLQGSRVLKRFYTSTVIKGKAVNGLNQPVGGIRVHAMGREVISDDLGEFYLPHIPKGKKITLDSKSFETQIVTSSGNQNDLTVTLGKKEEDGLFARVKRFFSTLFND